MTDQELLLTYQQGFNDELRGETVIRNHTGLKLTAYQIGRKDAWAGDDVSSVDLQSEEEILKKIKMLK